MRRLLYAALVLVAGCGGNPETSRLAPGSQAYAHSGEYDVIVIKGKGDEMQGVGVGTKVTVVEDDEPDDLEIPGNREVRVRVAEGEREGLVGKTFRTNLRPSPK